jgi:L-asparagine transporter-like permease|tara:strand:+ start:385 stop:528 length:144 start_codon:yes stop_codon:yes gene_type:complete
MCQQDSLHKSMIDNPLGFIIFYVFAIVFVALLFQLSKKDFSSKRKKK